MKLQINITPICSAKTVHSFRHFSILVGMYIQGAMKMVFSPDLKINYRGARDCAPFYENKSQGKIARRSLLSKVPRSPFRLYEGYDVSLLSAL